MRKRFFFSQLLALLGIIGSASGQTSTASAPTGFYRLDLAEGFQTVGVSVVNPASFGSWIRSSGSTTITSTDLSVDVGAFLDPTKAYYVEIIEGPGGTSDPLVGHRFEVMVGTTIAAPTANGVVVVDVASERTTWDATTTVPDLTGYRFVLRAHVTLGQVFDPSALHGATDFADADQVQIYDGIGFTIYYVLGNNTNFAQWTAQVGDFSSEDDLPIVPGHGLIFKRSALSPGAVSLRVQGVARTTPFVQPLEAGFNLVAEGFPAPNSLDGKNAYPGVFGNEDRVQLYDGAGFTTYQLYSDGASFNLWVLTGDDQFEDQSMEEIFDYRSSALIDVDTASSDYRISPPYSP